MSSSKYDAIVIGGGHNGLVCAAYLAKAGKRTLVIERRPVLGGAAVTGEIAPGFRGSTFSYLMGAFNYSIYKELGLDQQLDVRPMSDVFCPIGDDEYLQASHHDPEITRRSFARFSKEDADAYIAYREMIAEITPVMQILTTTIPPDISKRDYKNTKELIALLWKLRRSQKHVYRIIDIASQSANDFLSQWFKRQEIRAYFAFMASIGNFVGPNTPGSALLMLGYTARDDKNPRGHARGGMGAVTQGLWRIGESHGVQYHLDDPVAEVVVSGGHARGVRTKSGKEFSAEIIVSNAHPKVLFGDLVKYDEVPAEFHSAVQRIRTFSTAWKINVATDRAPQFRLNDPNKTGMKQVSSARLGIDIDYLENAYLDAKAGWYSKKPFVSMIVPSHVDDTLAPEGKHVVLLYGGHAPYDLKGGNWENERENFANSVFDVVEQAAPGFKASVVGEQVLTPRDIEAIVGMPHGHILHSEIMLDQMFAKRPVPGYADYKTPIQGLYQCGSACHPGGGVTGLPGYNAARVILGT